MSKNNKKVFKWRGMTTFLLILVIVVDTFSGIILYTTPSGKGAHWTGWSLWGLDKWQWRDIHIIFSLLLLLIIVAHLYFNWRVVFHFFWSRIQHTLNLKWELLVAAGIILFVLGGTLFNLQPFKVITQYRDQLKLDWRSDSFVSHWEDRNMKVYRPYHEKVRHFSGNRGWTNKDRDFER